MKSSLQGILMLAILPGCNSPNDLRPQVQYFNDFPSAFIQARNVEVLLPPDYDTSQTYDVLYMHDGQNIFHPETSYTGTTWGVREAFDSLLQRKVIRPAIVVAIWNTPDRIMEYLPNQPPELLQQKLQGQRIRSDEYLKFLVHELKPFIDSNFSTKPGRQNTFIMGSSMGGLISLYAFCEYPGVFGGAACLSTHWPAADGVFLHYLRDNLPHPNGRLLYFDHGTLNVDSLYEPYQKKVDEMLIQKGYQPSSGFMSLVFEGADHNELAWRSRLHIPLKFLLGN